MENSYKWAPRITSSHELAELAPLAMGRYPLFNNHGSRQGSLAGVLPNPLASFHGGKVEQESLP